MAKTQVYSWRVSPDLLAALEREARREKASVSALLDHIAEEWLDACRRERTGDDDEQARLHAAAAKTFGKLSGGDPHRSERVRATIRGRLQERRASSATSSAAAARPRARRTG